MYATIPDFRAEGITAGQATDDRLLKLIEEASAEIERITGWFFEPREKTVRINGRGTQTIEPPAPPIVIWSFTVDNLSIDPESEDLDVVGCPASFGFCSPRISLRDGLLFPRGLRNVEAYGVWGYTEDDGTPYGRTPLAIKRACMLLVMRHLPFIGDVDAVEDARNRWRLVSEKTRDQSYTLSPPATNTSGLMTGDPEVDSILGRYMRPLGLGAT